MVGCKKGKAASNRAATRKGARVTLRVFWGSVRVRGAKEEKRRGSVLRSMAFLHPRFTHAAEEAVTPFTPIQRNRLSEAVSKLVL
jgi:hypothetical protein